MASTQTADEQSVRIPVGEVTVDADLVLPERARGLVVFAHGSGSSRHSPRNRAVAGRLQRAGLGTLLMDLLTGAEERQDARTAELRFDIPLLAERVGRARRWLAAQKATGGLTVGYFGASTGAAAALVAAARSPDDVAAVVSRGGRPDLAGDCLPAVRAPTLLIVGGSDTEVLQLNRLAMARLRCQCELTVVPGATHLFPEPGAMAEVSRRAVEWFTAHLHSADGE